MSEIQPGADAGDTVYRYHDATKHRFHGFARGPGRLDWATQPDPFRRYAGAAVLPLSHPPPDTGPDYESAFLEGGVTPVALDRDSLAQLLYDSLALSAWKQAGTSRWALRVNPSSGNLHPTEGYLLCGPVEGLTDTPLLAHYAPAAHALEVRRRFTPAQWQALVQGLPAGALLVGFSSIPWREAWKYGERAFRYCQHDIGHAIAALGIAAAGLGWKAVLLDALSDDALTALLGLSVAPDPEVEIAECLLAVFPQGATGDVTGLSAPAVAAIGALACDGVPNRLSPTHRAWPIIDEVAAATRRPADAPARDAATPVPNPSLTAGAGAFPLRRIIHQRRSAVALDGRTGITRAAFYQMLLKAMPGRGQFPFNALPWAPCIHLALFVHRVQGVDPGLYCLARDPDRLTALRAAFDAEFDWALAPAAPPGLPLYRLRAGDCRALAARLSCFQDIAGDGVFSLGMLAEFDAALAQYGPWFYRRLYWEAGAVGQLLYLEAEASGVRATGIGCFFDDPVHDVLGLRDQRFQSIYHFTVGGALEDLRLMTYPPYGDPGLNPGDRPP
ncbi:MAG TPA: SagB/ThcOx family dehydrogenase [Acidiferrobacterales bacterium]